MELSVYKTVLNDFKQLELKEAETVIVSDNETVEAPDAIVSFLRNRGLFEAADEYFYLFCLNVKGRLIGVSEVSHGGNCTSIVPVREIFQKALLIGATYIIVAHNHPSGDTEPSINDIEATTKLVKAGKLLEIEVLDHIIVGSDTSYFSFVDRDLMPSLTPR